MNVFVVVLTFLKIKERIHEVNITPGYVKVYA